MYVPKGRKQRRLHKAFLRYHDPENWPLLREALRKMGKANLIGNGKQHLVPNYQPSGTGRRPEGTRTASKQRFVTKHTNSQFKNGAGNKSGDTQKKRSHRKPS